MRTSPWVGGKLPAMTLTKVDLPAPLSPMSPRTSPESSVRSTSLSAWMAPKCLDTDCNSRIGNPSSSASAHAKSPRSHRARLHLYYYFYHRPDRPAAQEAAALFRRAPCCTRTTAVTRAFIADLFE